MAMVTEAFAGGVYEWLKLVCPGLSRHGFDVTLAFWPRPETPPAAVLEGDFDPCRLVDLSRGTDGRRGPREYVRGVAALLDRERPDVLHLHSSWAGLGGRVALAAHRRWSAQGYEPALTCYTPHCFAFLRQDLSLPMRVLVLGAECLLARTPGVICAACGPGESRLAARLGAKIVGCYNGVVPLDGRPASSSPRGQPLSLSELGAATSGDGGDIVLSGGRLDRQKDPLFMIDVAARVIRERPATRFVWIGSGHLEEAVRRRLARLGPPLRERIEFRPWARREDFLAALSEATIYFHTARWEGLSLAILEAMGAGTPVVVRAGPGCHDVVEESGSGLTARDAQGAAAAIGYLLDDAPARRDFADRGRAAVRGTYNLERLLSDLTALYRTAEGG